MSTEAETLLANATVLVADDHQSNLVLLERILQTAGIVEIHATTESREVTRLFHEVRPDIVLLDLHMPGLDGIEVMDEIRRSTTEAEFVPVVVLTADGTQHAKERVLGAGADDFLTKPLDRTEVVLRVRNLLHTRSLHERLRASNAELRSEVEVVRAERDHADATAAAKRARILQAIDDRQFSIVFQPIVDLRDDTVVGYEALSRFEPRPVRPPDEWFSEAAEVGLGIELELAAMAAALADGASIDGMLALNVSAESVTSGALAELVADQPPGRIVLEITEHVRVDDYERLVTAVAPLRQAGALLAVDDAGAGFASLSHILRLQPDIIKLDISLVRDIDNSPIKRALSSSLVTFASDIGARIVAEGIETTVERRVLEDLGVTWAQGYHLGRPAPLR